MTDKKGLSPSEALYGFVAWLVSRDEVTTFSGHHNPFPAADRVAEFCQANNLSDPEDGWQKKLARPNGEPWAMQWFDDLFDDEKTIALTETGFGARVEEPKEDDGGNNET